MKTTLKRVLSLVLAFAAVFSLVPVLPAMATGEDPDERTLLIPENTVTIADGAFEGDSSFDSVVIPKTVTGIGSRAFAACEGLKEIYFGKNENLVIDPTAFTDCGNVHFFVFPGSSAEFFALTHGFECDIVEEDTPSYTRLLNLVKDHGGTSVLKGSMQSERLIVMRSDSKLPDITAYNPVQVIRDEDLFYIQFDTVQNTAACYAMLKDDPGTVIVEDDRCMEVLKDTDDSSETGGDVSAAAIVNPDKWDTDDPMGFETYAPYIAENANGNVTIAVLDSGISRQDAYSRLLREDGINMCDDGADWDDDDRMHGSVIASVISDCVEDAPVSIMSVRIVKSDGNTMESFILNALKYIIKLHKKDPSVSIINLSSNFQESELVAAQINEAIEEGITVVVAAGNETNSIDRAFPANMDGVVTVAGIDSTYKISNSSNYGSQVDYTAPDANILTSAYSWVEWNKSTSFAAPMIASALALLELDPYHTVDDLNKTCTKVEETGTYANSHGNGLPHLDKISKVAVRSIEFAEGTRDALTVGENMTVSFSILPKNATNQNVTIVSDNPSVIRPSYGSDGNVTLKAVSRGTATITASVDDGAKSVVKTFRVIQPVNSIEIYNVPDRLALNNTRTLYALATPTDADDRTVEWHSTNETVATVDETGEVNPVSVGEAEIYAIAKDGFGAISETVRFPVVEQPDPQSVILRAADTWSVITGDRQMIPGETFRILSAVEPSDADQNVVFSSSDASVAAVSSDGSVTALNPGTARITASSVLSSVYAAFAVNVAVMPGSIAITGNTTFNEKETSQFSAVFDRDDVTDKSVQWSSSDTSVATVDTNGLVTGVNRGSAVITAVSNADNNKTASVTVMVRHPYTVIFDSNGGNCSGSATKTAYSGESIGELPSATKTYHQFQGWYTAAGEYVYAFSAPVVTDDSLTLYAHWQQNIEYGWSTSVPAGADATATSYSYRLSYAGPESSYDPSYVCDGYDLYTKSSGSDYYASFQSGFNTGNSLYSKYNITPHSAYDNASEQCVVTNDVIDHWIYWHWMYDVSYSGSSNRPVASSKGSFKTSWSSSVYFKYFTALESTIDCARTYDESSYCCGNKYYLFNGKTFGSSGGDHVGTWRYIRTDVRRCDYIIYGKTYKYHKDFYYESVDPGTQSLGGQTVSNKTVYYKYRYR